MKPVPLFTLMLALMSAHLSIAQRLLLYSAANGKQGFINESGQIISPATYDKCQPFSGGMAVVVRNNKFGFIDQSGRLRVEIKYDNASWFTEGLALVQLNHKCGFVNKDGVEVIPLTYDWASSFSEGLAAVSTGDKTGFIDKSGKMVIPARYDNASDFSSGLSLVTASNTMSFIDKTAAEIVIAPRGTDKIEAFTNGRAAFRKDWKWGFIDNKGKVVVAPQFDEVYPFFEGLALVGKGDRKMFINASGKVVFQLPYEQAYFFSQGLCAVRAGDKYGYINTTGKLAIPLHYDYAGQFTEGFAYVELKGEQFAIDKLGRRLGQRTAPLASNTTRNPSSNAEKEETIKDPNNNYVIHKKGNHYKVADLPSEQTILEQDLNASEEMVAANTQYKWYVYRQTSSGKLGLRDSHGSAILQAGFDAIDPGRMYINCSVGAEQYKIYIDFIKEHPEREILANEVTAYWVGHQCQKCFGTLKYDEEHDVTTKNTTMQMADKVTHHRVYNEQTHTWSTQTISTPSYAPQTSTETHTVTRSKRCPLCHQTGLRQITLAWSGSAYILQQ